MMVLAYKESIIQQTMWWIYAHVLGKMVQEDVISDLKGEMSGLLSPIINYTLW